jgi:outer membrane protein assembly factor BamD (BamD/ComL family)
MKFEAQISLLEHTKSSQEALDLALTKMARKSNNYPYLDRIYYAKGNIALKSGLNEEAIKNFQKSVASSLDNNSQRALSSLTVARIFFAAANYRMSACYYDSALAVIDQNHPDYEEIVSKTNGLASLVKNLDMIAREDSLQKMALMPEKNRNSIINDIIAKIAEEENLRKKEEQNQLNNQNYFRGQQYRANFNNSQQSGSQSGSQNNSMWYFYNPVTAGMGKTEFQQIWGKRKLEDNWRRKNKISLNPGENEIAGQSGENLNTESLKPKESDPKSMAYYLQDLPLTDSLMQSSHDRIKSALFAAGRTYLSVLKDEPHAISIFEELNKRYPESIYELPSWIELHRLKYQTEQYRDRITEKYPNSNYAKYLLNPNFFKELEAMKQLREGKYREATALYQKGDYAAAGKLVAEVMALQPDSILLPKAKYIELISKGKNTTQAEFSKMAEQYLADYPGSPAKPIVSRIKELIQQNSLSELEKMIAKIDSAGLNQLSGKPDKNSSAASEGKFSYDEALFHYFIISYPASAKIDVNRLIFDIANFNIDYFTSYDFDLEEIKLNDQISMVVVRSLPDKEEGLGYFANIIKQKDVFKTLQKTDYHYFIASSSNYRKLIADQDLLSYLSFFVQNYSKTSSPAK